MTEDIIAILDVCKISCTYSVLLIEIIANTLGIHTWNLILKKSSFNRASLDVWQNKAEKIREAFDSNLETAVIY